MSSNNETVEVNKEELRRAGDLIVMRLMEVQSYLADLGKAYVQHVKSITDGEGAHIELPLGPTFTGGDFPGRASSPGAKSEAGGPKKRKRAPADPNAPKRALTPYFLFMQTNRPQIAEDLGDNARPKDVADEGTRRWQNMDEKDRAVWKQIYAENYEKYKKDMAAYKATKAEEDHDPAATQLQQDFAGAEPEHEAEPEAEPAQSDEDTSSDSESESPSPPKAKTPTPPRSTVKRPRISKAKEAETPAKSPVKRGRKAAVVEPASASKDKTPADTKRKGGKKRKSETS
ncbi:hypothetical protein PENANT_c013G05032 [Penicillium antarcticum]|uniref:HMG box domain-containing protein n=1 Tax=Penicillium antarcticum TaxID=416450 RepID=A0A1V6Q4P0_9EURO|nr:uncharacterized protein N7508_004154 [Penicillium antarcticum]KAJ5308775.1 hypothetical protein N7508_004154 [Penicillium antarcticum]OQD84219.1 hypothetical protein PENANT_c013G05032 [Penicillium antarcticum]